MYCIIAQVRGEPVFMSLSVTHQSGVIRCDFLRAKALNTLATERNACSFLVHRDSCKNCNPCFVRFMTSMHISLNDIGCHRTIKK